MLGITMSISQIRKLRLRAIAQSPTSKSVRAKIQIQVRAPLKSRGHSGKSEPVCGSLLASE